MPVPLVDLQLQQVPSLQPLIIAEEIVQMPPLDSLRYTPYAASCPDMHYGTGVGLWGQGTGPLKQPMPQLK